MSTKYSEIMNKSGLAGKLKRMTDENQKDLFDVVSHVTEKTHGENFRVGIDGSGEWIGQKNMTFREFEKHPNWNRMNEKTKYEIDVIHAYIRELKKLPKYKAKNITFYGELYGNGMQKGFTYNFEGLEVRWFDIKANDKYFDYTEAYQIFDILELDKVFSFGEMSLRDALDLDIENMSSQVANEDYIEGVVINPIDIPDWWKFSSRLIIKYKTAKFAEAKQGKHKSEKPINNFVSEYVDFVTEARIEHAIEALKEQGTEILYEMKDLQYIPKAVIADIEKEENNGEQLVKEDRKYLGSYIPKFYKQYLDKLLEDYN